MGKEPVARHLVEVIVNVVEIVDKPEGGSYYQDQLVARRMVAVVVNQIDAMKMADAVIGSARRQTGLD